MAHSTTQILRDLGSGLIMRRSTPADAEPLAEFNKLIHRDPGVVEPDEPVATWTRDLLTHDHPTFNTDDFTIVEDTYSRKIVSSLNTISQTWSYGGISFGVGRPELVGTLPEYRRRGLVRAQFEVIHAWSAERGELLQAITGIPHYYRQFGYEMAMVLGGGRSGLLSSMPKLKEGMTEPFRVRPTVEDDLPFIIALDAEASRRWLVACVRDAAQWRYELMGKSAQNVNRIAWCIAESPAGEPVGLLGHYWKLQGTTIPVSYFEVKAGVSWLAVVPSALRYLQTTAQAFAQQDKKTAESVECWFPPEHPFFAAAQEVLPRVHRPYAWYLRVTDLPGFIRHVGPVLEERLARSIAVGYTGELKLSFYRSGICLIFEGGRLVSVEPWQPSHNEDGAAAFPGLSFLQLVFGFHSLEELRVALPDCWYRGDEARALLAILFPQQASCFWPVA